MHPIYGSTACVARHFPSARQLLRAMADAGIHRVELGHCPPLDEFEVPGELRKFRGIEFLVHNYFPPPQDDFVLNLASAEDTILQRSRQFCTRALELCGELGVPSYSVHSGFLADFEPSSLGRQLVFHAITPYEKAYKIFAESVEQLISKAAKLGVRLLIEPNVVAPFNLVQDRNQLLMLAEPREFRRLLGDFEGADVGVLLDLGHLRVSATTLQFDWRDFVEATASAIGAFHLHDNNGASDQHQAVAADSWELELVRRPEFDGLPVVNEARFPNIEALAAHNCWLDRQLNGPLISVP